MDYLDSLFTHLNACCPHVNMNSVSDLDDRFSDGLAHSLHQESFSHKTEVKKKKKSTKSTFSVLCCSTRDLYKMKRYYNNLKNGD